MVYDERDDTPETAKRDGISAAWAMLGIVLLGGGMFLLCALGVIREAAVQQ